MTDATLHAEAANGWQLSIPRVADYVILYAVLVGYGMLYEYFFADQLTQIFRNDFVIYDWSRPELYRLTEFVTPLALLPMGTRLRTPAQYIVGVLSIFVFIPTPLVFIPMVNTADYWSAYLMLWTGYLIASTMSSLSFSIELPRMSDTVFRRTLYWVMAVFAFAIIYTGATNHFSFVGLDEAEEARKDITLGIFGYPINSYSAAFGGLFLAMAVMLRKPLLAVLGLAGFVGCYGILSLKSTAIIPLWIIYIYLAHRMFFRDSMVRFVLTVMLPFVAGIAAISVVGLSDRTSIAYFAFTTANYRLYAIPAMAFSVYHNYFLLHPVTYGSHVNVIARFIDYPYLAPLSVLMNDVYHMGNFNASFVATDGLAAGGVTAIPFASLAFGLAAMLVNSCMRGLNSTLMALVMAAPAIIFIDVGIGAALLTNGLGPLAILLLFAPRDAPWNKSRVTTG